MKVNLTRFWLLPILLDGLFLAPLLATDSPPDARALTFFGWSDQHVQTNGDAEHLVPAIDAMNALPGAPQAGTCVASLEWAVFDIPPGATT